VSVRQWKPRKFFGSDKWPCNLGYVSTITYVPIDQGWLYLAAMLDCFSRKIVGWAMNDEMTTELVGDALKIALY
jgi:putative transposase